MPEIQLPNRPPSQDKEKPASQGTLENIAQGLENVSVDFID